VQEGQIDIFQAQNCFLKIADASSAPQFFDRFPVWIENNRLPQVAVAVTLQDAAQPAWVGRSILKAKAETHQSLSQLIHGDCQQ
jgi:hypothetical protein